MNIHVVEYFSFAQTTTEMISKLVDSNFRLERLYIAIKVKADQIEHGLQNEIVCGIKMISETEKPFTQFFLNFSLMLFLILLIRHCIICLMIS